MKLIGFLEYGGFGALVSRRLLITYLAEKYGRSAVIVYRNCLYDDPYTSEHTIPEGTEIVPFTYSKDQDDKYAFFDFDYYWNNDLKFREFGSFDTEFDYIEKGILYPIWFQSFLKSQTPSQFKLGGEIRQTKPLMFLIRLM